MADLEVTRATVKRYLTYLKDTFGVPIHYDRSIRKYRADTQGAPAGSGLEGLWFTARELHALLTMEQLVRCIEPGVLKAQIEPIKERLTKILGANVQLLAEIEKRVRVLPMTARPLEPRVFQTCLTALVERKRVKIAYSARSTGETSRRVVSPQRLVYYRDNWYLDAWCHSKHSLRMFSLDAVNDATLQSEAARDMPEHYLQAVLESGYGIFSGRRTRTARLRFSAQQARYVCTETWHPKQRTSWDRHGNLLLQFPYSNYPELVMDLLRHIPEVEVLGPKSLRNLLAARIKTAAQKLS
jgi:predicted DNA-binding transcriptional regulator YafY